MDIESELLSRIEDYLRSKRFSAACQALQDERKARVGLGHEAYNDNALKERLLKAFDQGDELNFMAMLPLTRLSPHQDLQSFKAYFMAFAVEGALSKEWARNLRAKIIAKLSEATSGAEADAEPLLLTIYKQHKSGNDRTSTSGVEAPLMHNVVDTGSLPVGSGLSVVRTLSKPPTPPSSAKKATPAPPTNAVKNAWAKMSDPLLLDYASLVSTIHQGAKHGGEAALHAALILQALRWRITKTKGEQRIKSIARFIEVDIICRGFEGGPDPSTGSILDSVSKSNDLVVQEEAARLINAIASDRMGRAYLLIQSQDSSSTIRTLCSLIKRSSPSRNHKLLQQCILTLSKLSLHRKAQTQIIKEGLLSHLIDILSSANDPSTLEHGLSLLLNLVLRTGGRAACDALSDPLMKLCVLYLKGPPPSVPATPAQASSVRCYINGILYSCCERPIIRSAAKSVWDVIQEAATSSDKPFSSQLNHVLGRINEPLPPLKQGGVAWMEAKKRDDHSDDEAGPDAEVDDDDEAFAELVKDPESLNPVSSPKGAGDDLLISEFALKEGDSLRRSRNLADPDSVKLAALTKTVEETLRHHKSTEATVSGHDDEEETDSVLIGTVASSALGLSVQDTDKSASMSGAPQAYHAIEASVGPLPLNRPTTPLSLSRPASARIVVVGEEKKASVAAVSELRDEVNVNQGTKNDLMTSTPAPSTFCQPDQPKADAEDDEEYEEDEDVHAEKEDKEEVGLEGEEIEEEEEEEEEEKVVEGGERDAEMKAVQGKNEEPKEGRAEDEETREIADKAVVSEPKAYETGQAHGQAGGVEYEVGRIDQELVGDESKPGDLAGGQVEDAEEEASADRHDDDFSGEEAKKHPLGASQDAEAALLASALAEESADHDDGSSLFSLEDEAEGDKEGEGGDHEA